ncbi:hypothetical protein G6M16_010675 [Agrobacterium tumefaciens]|nr:hypothetical protein [Agrobacterium tumefaciens]WCA58143.1 hypothetical protein G6M16_010675 [Agrobacterium tumefaciens]
MQYDEIMEDILAREAVPSVDAFGGIDRVLSDGKVIGASIFPDVFVELVLPFRSLRKADVDRFIENVLMSIDRGAELDAIANYLLAISYEDTQAENAVFRRLLDISRQTNRSVRLRAAALKAALGFARDNSIRLTRLIADLVDTDLEDDPSFIAHAARIAGVLLARTRNPALLEFLTAASTVSGSGDQVHLELGLVALHSAIEGSNETVILQHLREAHRGFARAASLRESRYDARIFASAVELLIDFHENQIAANFETTLARLKEDAWAYMAYSGADAKDPILGALASQTTALVVLIDKLSELDRRLNDVFWLEATNLIETHLLFAYEANRTVFAAEPGKGLDCVIRPQIEARIFANHAHAMAIIEWIRQHGSEHEPRLVRELNEVARRLFREGGGFPIGAESESPSESASRSWAHSTDPAADAVLREILTTVETQHASGATRPVMAMIQSTANGLAEVADYKDPSVRRVFNTLVYYIALFLELKLDGSREQDSFSKYLFQHSPLPVEKDLQQDFLRHGKSNRLPVDDEIKGIAGGRADIRYKADPHRMIIEVKRELSDASFDNLMLSYGDQTVIYQATNVKLGVMLVLDLSKPHLKLAHMDTWYETRTGDLLGDGTHRGVLVVRIPGRRGVPSAATLVAKSAKVPKTGKAASKSTAGSRGAKARPAQTRARKPKP